MTEYPVVLRTFADALCSHIGTVCDGLAGRDQSNVKLKSLAEIDRKARRLGAPVFFSYQDRVNAIAGQRMFFAELLQCSPLRKSGEDPAISFRLAGHL